MLRGAVTVCGLVFAAGVPAHTRTLVEAHCFHLTCAQGVSYEMSRALLSLPYYGVFDDLEFSFDRHSVILSGHVVCHELRSDAAVVAAAVAGVARVQNRIELLPDSAADDRIRMAEFTAIYADPALASYARSSQPAIHIVVAHGNVSLIGAVRSEGDRQLAGERARTVAAVSSVTNQLQIEP